MKHDDDIWLIGDMDAGGRQPGSHKEQGCVTRSAYCAFPFPSMVSFSFIHPPQKGKGEKDVVISLQECVLLMKSATRGTSGQGVLKDNGSGWLSPR